MDYLSTYKGIVKAGEQALPDRLSLLKDWYSEYGGYVRQYIEATRIDLRDRLLIAVKDGNALQADNLNEFIYKTFLITAPDYFDDYMLALEYKRPYRERFYEPRRAQLLEIVNAMQDLEDKKLNELFLSAPPRIGKSMLSKLFCTWIMGRHPDKHNLYCSYSDTITRSFYDGILEVLQDNYTYRWNDIFPEHKVVKTNADTETIDVDRAKQYKTMTCRSLYGTLNGATDCDGIMVNDDLIGSIEEALNKERLVAAWEKVDNNLIPRAKEGAGILWIGTRWSNADPIGLRSELVFNDIAYAGRQIKQITIPALNDKDESNFDYKYGVGFSTEYYRQRRASFERNNDYASWSAQYMGEPIERTGALFEPGEMRFYDGVLPEGEPDRAFMAVDPAWGGGDFTASPVCLQYGDDIFVPDVVYTSGDKTISRPEIARLAKKWNVSRIRVEATKSTSEYADGIRTELGDYKCVVETKPAGTNKSKQARILDKYPDIREHFVFLKDGKRSKAYSMYMQNVLAFSMAKKRQHDDAPDSLCMAVDMMAGRVAYGEVSIFKRQF